MDINDQMLSKFKNFLNDLIKVFPEHKESIEKNYSDIFELETLDINNNEIVSSFLNQISNISDSVMNKQSDVFTDDLFLIKDISMNTLWSSDISKKTKESIWKYLNIFCLINLNVTSGDAMTKAQQKLLSGEKVTKKELLLMKKFKKLNENINKEDDTENNSGPVNFEGLENTSIGGLAKEITEGLNIDENNAEDLLKPENMMNIFQTINSTLQSKIENKEIDMNNLFGEASGLMNNGMMENMMGMFGNMMGQPGNSQNSNNQMPDLSNMMNMVQQMQGQMPPPQQQTPRPQQQIKSNNSKSNHNPEVVKERLRKKLESKK